MHAACSDPQRSTGACAALVMQGSASNGSANVMGHRLAVLIAVALLAAPARANAATDGYFTTSDGIKIHYLTQGEAGSWVVLVHGYSGNAEGNWFANGIAPELAKKHRVVAIDCRNHGK